MHKFVRSLITEWRKLELPVDDATIIVAVSGGADSMSLLAGVHDLTRRKKLRLRVITAHFNHRLRGKESDKDEKFVRKHATEYGFEFIVGSGRISRKDNLEQNARDARYKFLAEVAEQNEAYAVLTAHTQNDQAETFLMNLIRGSGSEGLAGMKRMRSLTDSAVIARPLLAWARREDTEQFCRDHDIQFRSDSMNDDPAFTRVRVRKTIIPALSELNPRIVETLARTAELIGHSGAETGRGGVANDRAAPGSRELKLSALRSLARPDLYATLRSWLRDVRGDLRSIQLKHIEAIERLILSRKSGRTVELPGFGEVVKQGGMLVFKNIKVEK